MTVTPASSQQAAVDAALLLLERMGLSPDDLTAAPRQRAAVPTFADYVPVVAATVAPGTLRAYGSYWNRVVEQWSTRRLDEPTPTEIKQLVASVRAGVVPRRKRPRRVPGGALGEARSLASLPSFARNGQPSAILNNRIPARAGC